MQKLPKSILRTIRCMLLKSWIAYGFHVEIHLFVQEGALIFFSLNEDSSEH